MTTYQAVAAAPALHLAEFRRTRTLLVRGRGAPPAVAPDAEPGPSAPDGPDPAAAGPAALLPLLSHARACGCCCPARWSARTAGASCGCHTAASAGPAGGDAASRKGDEVDLAAPGWAVVGYSRAQALSGARGAAGALRRAGRRGELAGRARAGPHASQLGPHRLGGAFPSETTRPALFTALRTGFRRRPAARGVRRHPRAARARRRRRIELPPGEPCRGLGKLLVVAPDQEQARRYLALLRSWVPAAARDTVRLATSDERDAHDTLAAFRLLPEPGVLVTVAMAYEGLDAPEVAVVAALTHIRSRAWLEQMVARATRVDPHAGPYESQEALVFHPDDPFFAKFRWRMEEEQGTRARPRPARRQGDLPLWLAELLSRKREERGIVPLESNAAGTALRGAAARDRSWRWNGPRAWRKPRRASCWRRRAERSAGCARAIAELVAAQAVEDDGGSARSAAARLPRLQRRAEAGARQGADGDGAGGAGGGGGVAGPQPAA